MKLPSLLRRILTWIDDNILIVLSSFLLAFIPLYPKIPLRRLVLDHVSNEGLRNFLLPLTGIEEYIVRVRLEDIFILLTALIWFIWLLRKKILWKSAMLWMIIAYAVVGFVSTVAAIFVVQSVPLQPLHVGKTVLHYFRYLEYFSLFVILYSAVRRRTDLILGVSIFAITVFAISAYGYGQRYFYWPVYSTMNREASKGDAQVLTQYARVQSTFGGHYDMAAYLVVSLPLILALAYKVKQRWFSLALHVTFWVGTWLLLMSASRAPFAAYLVGVALAIAITTLTQSSWKERFAFGISRSIIFGVMSFVLIFYFGQDMILRLSHFVNTQPAVSGVIAQLNEVRKNVISDEALAEHPLSQERVLAMLPKGSPPPVVEKSKEEVANTVEETKTVASGRDQPPIPLVPPSPSPSPSPIPVDAYNDDVPEEVMIATVSAIGETTYIKVTRKRVYSECALEKELSLCIRQETLWPRAIEGFLANPLTGSGYATLTKEEVDQFTEADSTDNNFLRTLGETGILGFITFYGCVGLVLYMAARHLNDRDILVSGYSVGLLGGTIGLLLNAIYIDVFAASKVAQSYWALAGLFFGYLAVREQLERKAEHLPLPAHQKLPPKASPAPKKDHATTRKKAAR